VSRKRVMQIALTAVVAAISVTAVLPFLWIVTSSLKSRAELYSGQVTFLPSMGWSLENYRKMFSKMTGFFYYYRNSIIVSACAMYLTLLVGSLAAYAFARFRFRGRDAIFMIFIGTLMIPGEINLMGQYELMYHYGLLDSLSGLTLSYATFNLVMTIFIMRNVFEDIPQDLIDAAKVDGASSWDVFWEVMVPLGANGLVAAATFAFLFCWNEFIFALTMTYSPKAQTLPIGIVLLKGQWQILDYGALFASVMLSFLPIIIFFILLQKYFVKGLVAGAIKG